MIALAAGYQVVAVWTVEPVEPTAEPTAQQAGGAAPARGRAGPQARAAGLGAGATAAAITVAAAWGTGLAGVLLGATAVVGAAALAVGRTRFPLAVPTVIGALLPAIAAASVVLAVRVELWAGIFLILAVSLYDAGSFVFGAESSSRWAGPLAGVVGVLAVTFTLATVQVAPFERPVTWAVGGAVALASVLGQTVLPAFLPADAPRTGFAAGALRRLDAYLVAGPVYVACAWAFAG